MTARILLFCLGLLAGLCAFAAVVAVALAWASQSGAGWQSRHAQEAE